MTYLICLSKSETKTMKFIKVNLQKLFLSFFILFCVFGAIYD